MGSRKMYRKCGDNAVGIYPRFGEVKQNQPGARSAHSDPVSIVVGGLADNIQKLSFPIDDRRRIARRRSRPLIQLLRRHSDVGLLGDLDGVVDLDAEIANGAGYIRVSKQKLDRT